MPQLIPLAIGAGSAVLASNSAKKQAEKNQPQFQANPEYPEATGARAEWWNKLQDFGKQPGYGAIAPDWADIWQSAQKKVQQYFWGSPTDPGLVGKVKANAARNNTSGDPSTSKALLRLGATESNVLSDMATTEAQNKSQFEEQGRLNYLNSLQSLAGQKQGGSWVTPNIPSNSGLISTIGSGVADFIGQKQQQDWLKKILGTTNDGYTPTGNIYSVPSVYR